ncbi:MAG: alpha/beta hydrolase [Desulfovibrio sp.]|nr:alpha/beta hydrolase [Desulfovibrio sp.]
MKLLHVLFSACLIAFLAAPSGILAGEPLRWFMQPEGVQGSRTPYGDNGIAARSVQAGDARIYYEVYGEGRPVFIFHGGGVGSPYELGAIIDELRDLRRVIVVSSRGHGRSELGKEPFSFKQMAADMHAVMQAEASEPAPVLGFSAGAYAALSLAARHPGAVERIVAIGAGTLEPGFFPAGMATTDLEKADRNYVAQMRRLMPEPERLQDFLTRFMSFWHGASAGKDLFTNVPCPVLLVAGDEDDHAPVRTVLEAHQLLPCSRLCIVPKAWHACFLDNFPVTWAAVRQFLEAPLPDLKGSKKVPANSAK